MSDLVQTLAIATSAAFMVLVLELVRRRRLTEEYSLIWILCAGALLLLSSWRGILHVAARALGVHYPPALLVMVLAFFVFLVSLYFSVVVSRQRQQIDRLVEEVALLDADVRALRDSIRTVSPDHVVPRAARHSGEPPEQRGFPRQ